MLASDSFLKNLKIDFEITNKIKNLSLVISAQVLYQIYLIQGKSVFLIVLFRVRYGSIGIAKINGHKH